MGRASRARAAVRAQRSTNGGLLIRQPQAADEAAVVELLSRVEFMRRETGPELAHLVADRQGLDPSCAASPRRPGRDAVREGVTVGAAGVQ